LTGNQLREAVSVVGLGGGIRQENVGSALRGTVGTDTIPLDLFVVGPDTVSDGDRRWRLVRRP
jgi:hypothetical protein